VADEKMVSQTKFDELVKLLRDIRNDAAQKDDKVTYGNADKADAVLRAFVELSRIENDPHPEAADHVKTVVELAGPAMVKARAVLREHERWYEEHLVNNRGAINALDETLEKWLWPPDPLL
jgi:hypothetical protein